MTTGINVVPDPLAVITAGLNLAGAVVNLTAEELAYLNSPQMIQARLNVDVQKRKDQNTLDAEQGLKTGDTTKIDEDLS